MRADVSGRDDTTRMGVVDDLCDETSPGCAAAHHLSSWI